jgi:hypothetical protein
MDLESQHDSTPRIEIEIPEFVYNNKKFSDELFWANTLKCIEFICGLFFFYLLLYISILDSK